MNFFLNQLVSELHTIKSGIKRPQVYYSLCYIFSKVKYKANLSILRKYNLLTVPWLSVNLCVRH